MSSPIFILLPEDFNTACAPSMGNPGMIQEPTFPFCGADFSVPQHTPEYIPSQWILVGAQEPAFRQAAQCNSDWVDIGLNFEKQRS